MGIKIRKRAVFHAPDELEMGHKLWFEHVVDCDAISATANMGGFTVLNAIKMRFGWDTDMLKKASSACNERDEIAVLSELTPKLLLVPRTRIDDPSRSQFYIDDLFAAVDAVGVKRLQFTHYSFMDHLGFEGEVEVVLRQIFSDDVDTTLEQLVFEADHRVVDNIVNMLERLNLK